MRAHAMLLTADSEQTAVAMASSALLPACITSRAAVQHYNQQCPRQCKRYNTSDSTYAGLLPRGSFHSAKSDQQNQSARVAAADHPAMQCECTWCCESYVLNKASLSAANQEDAI
jgi:hypothetical protein